MRKKNPLKTIYYHKIFGWIFRKLYYVFKDNLVPDKTYISNQYKATFGMRPNLKNPISLNEKIVWLKLYNRTPLHTQCADKYAVREYVASKIGDKYLVPLYFQTKNPKDILPENIVPLPCIIKTNHDSGGGIFVHKKTILDWNKVQKDLKKRLRKNYYSTSKEWQYKNIERRIIVEKLLIDSDGNVPYDYKFHCFNGKVNMIQVDLGRGTKNHYRNWYSPDWKREPYKWSSPKGNGIFTDPSEEDVKKPDNLEKMIQLSEILSAEFDYVRVDWYDVDGQIYFGELTFHHDGGYQRILPESWDTILGQKLQLVKSNPKY